MCDKERKKPLCIFHLLKDVSELCRFAFPENAPDVVIVSLLKLIVCKGTDFCVHEHFRDD